jgi:hypothetical protein
MSRTHLRTESTGPLSTALCGVLGSAVTDDHAAVTCRLCMRALAAAMEAGTVTHRDPAEALVDAVAAGDHVQRSEAVAGARAPFELDAERWRRVMDRCMCGGCDVCRRMLAIRVEQHSSPYQRRLRARTEETPSRWSSPSAALEAYVAHKLDGYPIKAWGGTLEAMRDLGAFVQSEGAYSSSAERAAHDVVHVDLALREAYRGTRWESMGVAECIAILLAAGVGRLERVTAHGRTQQRYVPLPAEDIAATYGLRARDVERIVRDGRKRVGELLAERGLVSKRRAA